jgi:hypothetical protein
MLFMVIETFEDQNMIPVYRKARDAGRMNPDGLKYVDSWIEPNFSRCFQLITSAMTKQATVVQKSCNAHMLQEACVHPFPTAGET